MQKNRVNKLIAVLLLVTVFFSFNFETALAKEEKSVKKILYINSYHEGYKWSDDIKNAIEAEFSDSLFAIDMDIIYMDTHRMFRYGADDYFENMRTAIMYKLTYLDYDLIITSDNEAYQFVVDNDEFIDDSIPHLFCGVKNSDVKKDRGMRESGGLIAYMDYGENFELIGSLDPSISKIYYLFEGSDVALREEKVEFLQTTKRYESIYEYIPIATNSLDEIIEVVSNLPQDSVLFYGLFDQEVTDDYISYDVVAKKVAEASSVQVYCQYEFLMVEGLLGGKLISGNTQGEKVAQMAIKYFEDPVYTFSIDYNNYNEYSFNHDTIKRFDIPLEALPEGSNISNLSLESKKNILVLHSYNKSYQWTESIDLGIRDSLLEYDGDYEIYTEYMDLNYADNLVYMYQYYELFKEKYAHHRFDLIITSDEGAYDFAQKHIYETFGDIPLVFCGLNYYEAPISRDLTNVNGVLESYDIESTLKTIQQMQPDVTNIFVVCDNSYTGKAILKRTKEIESQYEGELNFEYTDNATMTEVLNAVSELENDTAILMMIFNKDRGNNIFNHQESLSLIYEESKVPIYSMWDFYLGHGIVGGHLTNGTMQGTMAGKMALSILNNNVSTYAPIVINSPNTDAFDMKVIEDFGLDPSRLPEDALIINKEKNFFDLYKSNRNTFNYIFLLLAFTVLIIIVLVITLRNSLKMNKKVKELATYDHLTGVFNRGAGIEYLKEYVTDNKNYGKGITICFMDLNFLKEVNDEYGHGEGDDLIITVVKVIKSILKKDDIVCRMGGDEFMVALTDVTQEEGEHFKIQLNYLLVTETEESNKPYEYSISTGLYHFNAVEDIDISRVIEIADTLMYRDKEVYRQKRREKHG